jgi:hypothetical protein
VFFSVCDVNVIVHSHKRLVGLILKLFMVVFFCRDLELFGLYLSLKLKDLGIEKEHLHQLLVLHFLICSIAGLHFKEKRCYMQQLFTICMSFLLLL